MIIEPDRYYLTSCGAHVSMGQEVLPGVHVGHTSNMEWRLFHKSTGKCLGYHHDSCASPLIEDNLSRFNIVSEVSAR